jgi:hypothetical protein
MVPWGLLIVAGGGLLLLLLVVVGVAVALGVGRGPNKRDGD